MTITIESPLKFAGAGLDANVLQIGPDKVGLSCQKRRAQDVFSRTAALTRLAL